ncbi:MAG TPA: N-6 DNA methylase [Bacteroidia bacterium]|nr:N-6 DNA methylase [Bacteroidia bacterium]
MGNKGGMLVGASHDNGGIDIKTPNGKIEAEGGEIIIEKKASAEYCEVLSEINQSNGGVAIPCDSDKKQSKKAKMGTKISSATTSELDKAVSDLNRVEKAQKMMKDANAIIRSKKNVLERLHKEAGFSEAEAEKIMKGDFRGRVGFSSYALTNNNANLKRLQERVKMLKKKVEGAKEAATSGPEKYTFENGFFEVNYSADRVQIYFEGMPTAQQKNDLKRNGWHWSYTNKAWQRKITPQAIRNAEYLFKATKAAKTELEIGIEVEQEHKETLEKLAAGEIDVKQAVVETAKDHLKEDPNYYSKLEESEKQTKLTKAVVVSNDIIIFCEQSDLPKPERELSNKGNTVYLSWTEEKIEAVIDAGSPVQDGIFLKHKGKMVDNYKLSQLREVLLKVKELLKPETVEILEPNTPEDFDEAIISKLDPNDGWLGNKMKERVVKKQIYDQLNSGYLLMEEDKEKETERIFKKFYDRTLLKEERVDLMSPEQKLAFKQMNQTGELANSLSKPEPTFANDDVFNGIGHNYKNQYELNKAIESLLTKKGDSHTDYTSDEKNFIRKYSGYGGLDKYGTTGKGGLFEYYTPKDVIEKMWALAYKYGYNNGPVLEPSVATGEFLQFAKPETRVVGFEISNYSAQICKILYPTAEIHLMPFEQHFIKNNFTMKDKIDSLEKFDLVIGNPPYGDFSIVASRFMTGMGEKDYTKAKNYVEYFIRRGLDLLNPGGLLIYIVGAQLKNGGNLFLDSGLTPVKEYLAQHSELLDAYRLPDSIFERTGVTSDIIVLRKN